MNYLTILIPLFYIITAAIYGIYFFRPSAFLKKFSLPLISFTILLHILYITWIQLTFKHFQITSIFELLSIAALAITIIYLYIEYRIGIKSTGVFVLIVASIFQTISSAKITHAYEIKPILKSIYVGVHSVSATFGYSAFIIASLYGIMYLMLFRDIKSRHFGIIYKTLPSLEELNEMNYKASAAGFIFMTLSITAGLIWLSKVAENASILDPKIITAILTWTIFGTNCLIKKYFGRGGLISSYLSFFGFIGIIFSMLVINIFLPTFHIFY